MNSSDNTWYPLYELVMGEIGSWLSPADKTYLRCVLKKGWDGRNGAGETETEEHLKRARSPHDLRSHCESTRPRDPRDRRNACESSN